LSDTLNNKNPLNSLATCQYNKKKGGTTQKVSLAEEKKLVELPVLPTYLRFEVPVDHVRRPIPAAWWWDRPAVR